MSLFPSSMLEPCHPSFSGSVAEGAAIWLKCPSKQFCRRGQWLVCDQLSRHGGVVWDTFIAMITVFAVFTFLGAEEHVCFYFLLPVDNIYRFFGCRVAGEVG